MQYNILPAPKIIEETQGTFNLVNAGIYLQNGLDARVVAKAEALRTRLCEKTGQKHLLSRGQEAKNSILICKTKNIKAEEYILEIDANGVKIEGGSDAGCFYGILTFLQILETDTNELSGVVIKDWPDMAYRGFYFDATRGRVPSVEGAKKLINRLASLKINALQFYVEHTFDFKEFSSDNRTSNDYLTAKDILEIDNYCYQNFIDFQPSLSTFGHLYELLSRKEYKHLCELENYEDKSHFWKERMEHHTIDAANPESLELVCSLIDQYSPLFRSEYFNICCDETFDLCRGRNQGSNVADTYVGFVTKIIDHVTACGKKVMMWADIALKYPHILSQLPADTVFLNWDYDASPNTDNIKKISELGLTQIVCPGTQSWATFIEKTSVSVPNILTMAKNGYENGVIGMLNTNWGDYGHTTHPECSLYGTILGACAAWSVDTQVDKIFNKAVSSSFYKTDVDIVELIKQLEICHNSASWLQCYDWVYRRTPECFPCDVKTIEKSIKTAQNLSDALGCAKGEKEILACLKNAADTIALLNMAALDVKLNGVVSEEWRYKMEDWFEEYKNCWLISSKPSEIMEIYNFLQRF